MKIKDIFKPGIKTFELSNESNKFYLVIIALLIFFAYLPTLQYDYAYNDQWRAFQYSMLNESPLIKSLRCIGSRIGYDIRCGRPFLFIGECIEHAWVGKISDFSKTRPIVLIVVILTAFCVGMALSPSVGGIANGTAIGALFVLSPGYAHMYYLGLSAIMMLIALILATMSYVFIRQAINENFHKNKILLSSVFFLAACMIYPAWAFVVFIFSLIDFLFCQDVGRNTKLKHLFIKILFFTLISIIYYLIIKTLILFLPGENIGNYEFSANFNPVYLAKRFLLAFLFYIAQPPLNTLYSSLRVMNIIFLFLVIVVFTVLFFKKNKYKPTNAFFSFLITTFLCIFLTFTSIIPWIASKMLFLGNRSLITFSLLMCALIGWIIFRVSSELFPAKKYISTTLIVFIILLPASAIQNKRTNIETGIKGTEIEAMRLAVHKWIDEYSFTSKRYVVVVVPKRPRPLFYDRVLDNVTHIDVNSYKIPDDPLYFFKMLPELLQEKNDEYGNTLTRLIRILNLTGYGESLEISGDYTHYFQMFTALISEKCGLYHPFGLMKTYNLTFAQEKAEEILDYSPSNIVFTVINQGNHLKTKHEILEINFSLITNSPEPLILDR